MEGKFGYDHNRSIEVHEYDGEMVYLRSYGSQAEAARHNNCDRSTINKAIITKNKTRQGRYYRKSPYTVYDVPKEYQGIGFLIAHVEIYKP
jgi:hypothetical protein